MSLSKQSTPKLDCIVLPTELYEAILKEKDFSDKLKVDENACPSTDELELLDKNRSYINEMIQPVIQFLIDAGLLMVSIESRKFLKKKYRNVSFGIDSIYVDGVLTLACGDQYEGCTPSMTGEGHPNLGLCDFEDYARESHRLARTAKSTYTQWLEVNEISVRQRYDEYQKLLKNHQ